MKKISNICLVSQAAVKVDIVVTFGKESTDVCH